MQKVVISYLMSISLLGCKAVLPNHEPTPATTWEAILSEKGYFSQQTYAPLIKSYLLFKNHALPKIADPVIQAIPIEENGEPLVDLKVFNHPRISLMPSPPTGEVFKGPNYHAGFACSGKMRQRLLHALVALLQMLEKNAAEFGFEADKIEIKVFEALRDINTQAFILQSKINDLLAKDKTLSPEEAEKEAYRWVSPVKNNIPVHTTGAAIDIRLMHQGALIDMGPFGVVWGNDSSAPTFSENLTLTQKMNRLFLHKSVHDVADPNLRLYNYAWEYWHFSIGDRYAQFLEHEDPSLRKAIYGAIHLSKQ